MCAHMHMPAMALLDRDGVYGAPRFYMAAKKAGIKAHMGAEVQCEISDFRLKIADLKLGKSESICNLKSKICNSFRLPLLVSSRSGYQNLCRLITKMKLRAQKGEGAVTKEELEEHAAGLICLTGGDDGPLAAALSGGDLEEARHSVECLTGIFGRGNVYVELQRHFHREQEARNRAAIEIARSLAASVAGHQWCLLCDPARARTLRRVHCDPQPLHAGDCRPPAGAQLRASSEIAAADAATVRRPARGHGQYAWNFRPASSSRWRIWDMNFPDIPCRKARP